MVEKKIGLRIEAGPDIGMGHAVRCVTLAEEFARRGFSCVFFARANDAVARFMDKAHMRLVDIPRLGRREEAAWLSAYTAGYGITVFDSYLLDDEYIDRQNASGKKVCCIDDNALYTYSCDYVINYNFFADELPLRFGKKRPEVLLGGRYCLLRDEFRNAQPLAIRKDARRVFVCLGGSDPDNITYPIVQQLKQLADVETTVVVGPANRNADSIVSLAAGNVNVILDPPSISEVMASCDVAVVSAGSIVYEVASLGMPLMLAVIADNQTRMRDYMRKRGFTAYNDFSEAAARKISSDVERLLADYEKRSAQSALLREMADKHGAKQVADRILG
jgi:UDP-2,4-diacetamido-2,4,6-trideoxy-beta-L-altropyranose hydrolase